LGDRDSPVLVIQAQCDRPEDERASLPLPLGVLDAFPFQKPLRVSAKTDRGRASLDEALADAVIWLRRNQGVDKIGKGRAEVKARLEAMRDDDAGRPPGERRHRLVTPAEFLSLCEKARHHQLAGCSAGLPAQLRHRLLSPGPVRRSHHPRPGLGARCRLRRVRSR
jgi:internalin A